MFRFLFCLLLLMSLRVTSNCDAQVILNAASVEPWQYTGGFTVPADKMLVITHLRGNIKINGETFGCYSCGTGTYDKFVHIPVASGSSIQYDSWGDIGTDAFGYLVALDNWGVGSEDNNFTQIDAGFTLYPNPADSEITVFADVSEDWNVSIYSSNGQEVLAEEILGKIKVINVSSLSPGNYVIAARSHRGHIGSSQLIVE